MATTTRGRRAGTHERTDTAAATAAGTSTETAATATAEGATDTAQPAPSSGISSVLLRGARAVVDTLSAPVSDSLLGRHPRVTTIAVDERVEDDAVVIDAELPGFAPGDITVAAERGRLFLHAVRGPAPGTIGRTAQGCAVASGARAPSTASSPSRRTPTRRRSPRPTPTAC